MQKRTELLRTSRQNCETRIDQFGSLKQVPTGVTYRNVPENKAPKHTDPDCSVLLCKRAANSLLERYVIKVE